MEALKELQMVRRCDHMTGSDVVRFKPTSDEYTTTLRTRVQQQFLDAGLSMEIDVVEPIVPACN